MPPPMPTRPEMKPTQQPIAANIKIDDCMMRTPFCAVYREKSGPEEYHENTALKIALCTPANFKCCGFFVFSEL
jgi:hypothetical protein